MFGFRNKNEEVWLKGFEAGFLKAWDWMKPFVDGTEQKLKKSLYDDAMNEAIKNLEPTIQNRIKESANGN
mgnify:CR=1 FL=1